MFIGEGNKKSGLEGYTVDDYIKFVRTGRFDKIGNHAIHILVDHIMILEDKVNSSSNKPKLQEHSLRMGFIMGLGAAAFIMLITLIIK